MKKLFITIFLTVGSIFILTYKTSQDTYLLSYSTCDRPVTYKIGEIDPRFHLTKEAVYGRVNEAAAIWNKEYTKPLFIYDEKGKVTINLVYDQRQELSSEVNSLEKQLDTDKNSLDPQVAAYKTRSQQFEQRLQELNDKIAYWNSQGGAPEPEYNQLQKERAELQAEAQELNRIASTLNQSTRTYNEQVKELNQTVKQLNRTLTVKPEEGIYDPNNQTIAIYFNNTRDELIHTLAHELGHARGLEHTTDPNAIMYGSSTEITIPSEADRALLRDVCQAKSYPQLLIERYTALLHQLQSSTN